MRSKISKLQITAAAGLLLLSQACSSVLPAGMEPIASGPFQPTFKSLKKYKCPEWYRDAKFGIWAHWSPQCAPEFGDWYAQEMYVQGSEQYNYHVAHYGHPSQFGYKDVCNSWKAENWDPDKLLKLYKRAGAKYFVALANHHDNFDNWDSKYQPWNSVNIGPHKDIIGGWAAAARKEGLYFGTTVHCARAWNWLEVSRGSDKEGPMAGVPYDGNLTKADGKGQWWEGYDPADLYAKPHTPGALPDQEYITKWFNRTKDLIDKYHPDLLYFDEVQVPFGDVGMNIFAHFYNTNAQRNNGKLEAVLNTKLWGPDARKSMICGLERGVASRIEPYPWQSETCIGGWHYYKGCHYQKPAAIIPLLVDLVSKNGNLLLSIPVKSDGTLDDDEMAFIKELTAWMDINGEGIFSTRPWKAFSDGPRVASDMQADKKNPSIPIRYTTKGNTLYAYMLGWPKDGKMVLKSLAKGAGAKSRITSVSLLGCKEKLKWTQNEQGLSINLPAKKPCDYVCTLKFAVKNLKTLEPALISEVISFRSDGTGELAAEQASLHGDDFQLELYEGKYNIGYWENPTNWASWMINIPKAGVYDLSAIGSSGESDANFTVEVAGQKLPVTMIKSRNWDSFSTLPIGKVTITSPGNYLLKIFPKKGPSWNGMNIRAVSLKPAE